MKWTASFLIFLFSVNCITAETVYQVQPLNTEGLKGELIPETMTQAGGVAGAYVTPEDEGGCFYWSPDSGFSTVVNPEYEAWAMDENGLVYGIKGNEFFSWKAGRGFQTFAMPKELHGKEFEGLSFNRKGNYVATVKQGKELTSLISIDGSMTVMDEQSSVYKDLTTQGYQPTEILLGKIDDEDRIYGGFHEATKEDLDLTDAKMKEHQISHTFVLDSGKVTVIDLPKSLNFAMPIGTTRKGEILFEGHDGSLWRWSAETGLKKWKDAFEVFATNPKGDVVGVYQGKSAYLSNEGKLTYFSDYKYQDSSGSPMKWEDVEGEFYCLNDRGQVVIGNFDHEPYLLTPK